MRLTRVKAVGLLGAGLAGDATKLQVGSLAVAQSLNSPEWEFATLWGLLVCGDGAFVKPDRERLVNQYVKRSRQGVPIRDLSIALSNLIVSKLAEADRTAAIQLNEELSELASRSRNRTALVHAENASGIFAAMAGSLSGEDLDRWIGNTWSWGLAIAEWVGTLAPDRRDLGTAPGLYAQAHEAWRHAVRKEFAEAQEWLDLALSDLRQRIDTVDSTPIIAWLLQAAIYLGNRQTAALLMKRLGELKLEPVISYMMPRPYQRIMGDAALLIGDAQRARDEYEHALQVCTTIGHRPERAITSAALAAVLLDHYPDEHDAAIEHLDFAIAEFREMKMQPSLERALRHRGLLKA